MEQTGQIGSPAERIAAGRLIDQEPDYFVQPFAELCKEAISHESVETLSKDDLLLYMHMLLYSRHLIENRLSIEEYVHAVLVHELNPSDLASIDLCRVLLRSCAAD